MHAEPPFAAPFRSAAILAAAFPALRRRTRLSPVAATFGWPSFPVEAGLQPGSSSSPRRGTACRARLRSWRILPVDTSLGEPALVLSYDGPAPAYCTARKRMSRSPKLEVQSLPTA